jgi:hypothetical protein
MEITGPLKIGFLDNDAGAREIHLDFKDEFRVLNLPQQIQQFQQFIAEISSEISKLDEADANRQGMLTILKICQQLLPHIEANEIPLEETIVVTIQTPNPFGNIQITTLN